MASDAEITAIARALNGVKTAGSARAAAGAAAKAAKATYPVLERLSKDRAAAGRKALDLANANLTAWYKRIEQVSYAAAIDNEWTKGRPLVLQVYQAIAGIEGEANYVPQTSNADILLLSLKEAPGIVGAAVGEVTKEAGKVAGNAVGGIFSGLGISGTLTLVVILAAVVLFLKRGTLLGRLLG